MNQKKYRLSKLNLNEVSLVASGDDPEAHVMIFKAAPEGQTMMVEEPIGVLDESFKYAGRIKKTCRCRMYTGGERRRDGRKQCERCGGVVDVIKARDGDG